METKLNEAITNIHGTVKNSNFLDKPRVNKIKIPLSINIILCFYLPLYGIPSLKSYKVKKH